MRKLSRIVAALVLFYLLFGVSLYLLQDQMIFMPSTLNADFNYTFSSEFEELNLTAEDGAVINALHFRSPESKGVVLYFHGNAGNLSRWGEIVQPFVTRGYDVLVMDYRGYGKSTGLRTEATMYADAQLCYDYLLDHYAPEDLSIYGRSLGSGIASQLASNNLARQLVLESPFYSIADVAGHRFPIYPVGWLLNYEFPSYQYLATVNYPITIFHGTSDFTIPYESGEKLFLGIDRDDKTLITIKNGGHNNLVSYDEFHQGIAVLFP